ncbi:hypothetical protein ABZ876_13665 [Streptomyces sp. NPDC046931]|uniref:hypothetical protein n=1 Tax=Streptomyces sp. NPDC046931 TaxID=3154806 RepID=UPI0033C6207C
MEGLHDARHEMAGAPAEGPGRTVSDRRWAKELYSSIRCAAALLAMLLLIDWGAGDETPWRVALWCGLSVLLFLVLCPRRISAGEGRLACRGLLHTRRVRTDLLVSVRCLEGISQRLAFRDAFGGRVELDPRVLVNNPDMWHRLSEDARKSAESGLLLCGATELRRVEQRIDRETALTVFKVSGLE